MFLEMLFKFLAATTKWAVAAIWTLSSENPAMSFTLIVLGGFTGVFVYTFFGEKISIWWKKKFKKNRKPTGINRRKRMLVRVKQDYGLMGIAFLTPLILSIPVGCIISFGLTDDKMKIMRFQFASVSLWTIIVFVLWLFRKLA